MASVVQDQYLEGEPNFQLDLAFVRLLCIGIVFVRHLCIGIVFVRLLCIGIVLHLGADCIEH